MFPISTSTSQSIPPSREVPVSLGLPGWSVIGITDVKDAVATAATASSGRARLGLKGGVVAADASSFCNKLARLPCFCLSDAMITRIRARYVCFAVKYEN